MMQVIFLIYLSLYIRMCNYSAYPFTKRGLVGVKFYLQHLRTPNDEVPNDEIISLDRDWNPDWPIASQVVLVSYTHWVPPNHPSALNCAKHRWCDVISAKQIKASV
jgi:hypothetical protein